MTSVKNMLARMATIAAMIFAVVILVRLFSNEKPPAAERFPEPDTTANSVMEESVDEVWTGAINYAPAYAALDPYADIAASTTASVFDPHDEYGGLPRSAGVDSVAAWCSACHTLQIVMQQRQNRDGWDYLLNWMVDKQGMAAPPPETRTEILDYLSREFSE